MKDVSKLYDRLNPIERVRAFVDAAGRHDTAEMDRLNDTCPRKTYLAEDRAYSRRKTWFWLLALSLHGDAARCAEHALFALSTIPIIDEAANPDLMDKMERAFEVSVRRYRAKMAAWDRFCDQTGIPADSVRSAYGIPDDEPMELAIDISAALGFPGPSDEEIDEQLQPMLSGWNA